MTKLICFARPTKQGGLMNSQSVASSVSVLKKKGSEDELKHQSDALDEALDESFPASDPVAVDFTQVDAKRSIPSSV